LQLTADAAPTACLEIAGDDRTVHVLNFLSAVGAPALWDEFYAPVMSAAGLGFHGASAAGRVSKIHRAPRSLACAVDALSIDAFTGASGPSR
jgi:hypothetical protein